MAQGTLPWQPFRIKIAPKSEYSPLFVAMAFRNRMQYRHSDLKRFICDDLATYQFNEFDSVTPEFKKVVGVHPLI